MHACVRACLSACACVFSTSWCSVTVLTVLTSLQTAQLSVLLILMYACGCAASADQSYTLPPRLGYVSGWMLKEAVNEGRLLKKAFLC